MRRLPPFFALRALESAARHRSYSRAADELAVTHGAVSQQIRRLEAELGAKLFERRGNTMAPTPAAQRLADALGRGFDVLQNAVAEFDAGAERDPLVISLDPQFASRWLPARLPPPAARRPARWAWSGRRRLARGGRPPRRSTGSKTSTIRPCVGPPTGAAHRDWLLPSTPLAPALQT